MSDNHGVKCGSPDESCSCALGGVVKRDTLTKRESVPDLLALEAENKRLVGVLEELADFLKHEDYLCWNCGAENNLNDCDTQRAAEQALSTPPPVTSALWRVLALELQFWDDKNTPKVEATRRLKESVDALTPELRTLIAEMAKGGQE